MVSILFCARALFTEMPSESFFVSSITKGLLFHKKNPGRKEPFPGRKEKRKWVKLMNFEGS